MVQCVCPLMPPRNTYQFTWVSLTLDVGYPSMAAPAKHSHCSLSWTRGISSRPPLLTLNVRQLLLALLHPCSHCSLDVGLLLSATAPDLGLGVAPLCHSCAVAAWRSQSLPLTLEVDSSSRPCSAVCHRCSSLF